MSRARAARKPELGELVAVARSRFQRVSARKVRMVADLIRGLTVEEAQEQLQFLHRPSAEPTVSKTLASAVANASELEELDVEPQSLLIGEIYADGGPILKRFMPRAMGRATTIRKRTSHLTIKLYKQA